MNSLRTPLKYLSLMLICLMLLSGCGSRAYVLQPATEIVNHKRVRTTAIVPDKDGNLVPNVEVDVPPEAVIILPK
jgi:hypothetical protein